MADPISLTAIRANKASYGWLTPLVISLDAITSAHLKPLADKDPLYDPFQVEDHLEEVSRLLDNCLAYRREIYDLQALATKTALEYELFSKQLESQKKLELNDGALKQLTAAKPHYVNASAANGDATLKAMASASLATTIAASDWEAVRTASIANKWQQLESYQKALTARHSEPGNALNYVERFNRVLEFYKQDVAEAFSLSRAAAAGIALTTNFKTDIPPLNENNYLDKLVEWNRATVRQMNLFSRDDIQSEITIPIRYLSSLKTTYIDQMKEDGAGELLFDLSDYFPIGLTHARLKGVGVTFSAASPEGPQLRYQQVAALVIPPSSRDPFGAADSMVQRHPIYLNANIGDKTSPVHYSTSPNLNNLSPKGVWSVTISKKMTVSDQNERPKRDATRVANVQLHLLLSCQLSAKGFKDFQI
jgi:hypothetical protein